MIPSQMKDAVILCRNAGITIWAWGHRGIGKSSIMRQVTEEREKAIGYRWGFADFRCSQIEASDLRGLPDREDGRTVYNPPDDLPHGEYKCLECAGHALHHNDGTFGANGARRFEEIPTKCPKGHENTPEKQVIVLNEGLLFLDELNRADDDVLQATFQLVLDRRLGRYILPTGWSTVVAGNFQTGDSYMVNSFNDIAFLDRFCHIDLSATSKEYFGDWTDFIMKRAPQNCDKIVQFCAFSTDHLIGKADGERGFSVTPSPRSWEFMARIEDEIRKNQYSAEVIREVRAGIVGMELANSFEQFSMDVSPVEIIERGLDDNEKKLNKLNRNQVIGVVWGVANHAKERFIDKSIKGPERKALIKNTLDFMQWVAKRPKERDMAVMLGRTLVEKETVNLGGAVLSNPSLAKMAAKYKASKETSWIAAIVERPDLQKLMSSVSFGL